MAAAAPDMNNVVLVGRLTKDPQRREMPDGRTVCELRLGVNDHRGKPTLFVDVTTYGDEADTCLEFLAKGRQVGVAGRLILDEWETKVGDRRSKHRVLGRVSFGKEDKDGDKTSNGHAGGSDA